MAKEPTPCTIVGQGAVGSFLTFYLSQPSCKLNVVTRQGLTEVIHFIDTQKVSVDLHPQPYNFDVEISNLLLPTKAYDIHSAFKHLQPKLANNANIILFNNGMGCIEEITPLLGPKQRLLAASVTHGVLKQASNVIHTGQGAIYYGDVTPNKKSDPLSADTLADCDTMLKHLPNCQKVKNIEYRLWQKLAINACINPITALNQQQNRSVLDKHYYELINDILNEFCQITHAIHLDFDFNTLLSTVLEVAKATGENFSSMNRDVYNKRRTEIDYINGYIVKKGQELAIKTPVNQQLVAQVKNVENRV
ncbi:hypothetical protein C2869_00330 [Saccharobesus litoralis]|uniref:2-dehydropantoate 2-reductase n=1 Tax=Saccharobesus litoralis TaxID=2172099 RepID=A0A2S0VL91_9ALTE|nr:2-dehydropantoate 2-reductase [Saccharobesus litoralis]AWB64979.1 hypothetical protein C2869_00330 [Saccharobesus litoralis]